MPAHSLSESSRDRLDEQPWWTEADRAEWELHFKEFFDSACLHQDWCGECNGIYKLSSSGVEHWCPDLLKDWDRMMEWRTARIIASKAQYEAAMEYERRRTNERTA